MSIIYNALRKAQENRQKKIDYPVQPKHISWLNISLLVIVVLLIVMAQYGYSPRVTKSLSRTKPVTTAPASVPVIAAAKKAPPAAPAIDLDNYKNSHVLSGIYLSESEKFALINNKFVHLGDVVDGMKIVSIEANRIVLRNGNDALILAADQPL